MKNILKLIRRFVGILFLSFVLLLLLNILLLFLYTSHQLSNSSPWMTAAEVAESLYTKDGRTYVLPKETAFTLKESGIWALFIDNNTLQVLWSTDFLPETVPANYTVSDIAGLTRGYIDGYPTFTGEAENGLVVLGYPKNSYWKHMWPSWDYQFIAGLPKTAFSILLINLILIFLIYAAANSRLLKSIHPIVSGIQDLPSGNPVFVRERGLLSELAASINHTSEILQAQDNKLRRKETARANWIAGVSHDIRTPLSMVMGYAGQLKDDRQITDDARQKAAVIVKQSGRIKNLISDLNLASKLEYNMQPIHPVTVNMVAVVRQVVVDFINMDIEEKYPITWQTDEALTACAVNADKDLIKRAVSNLIQNSISHNETGCSILVNVVAGHNQCRVVISDDGVGADDAQIAKLNHAPHYMVCDENTIEQRHGLGLLLVKQIMAAHGASVTIGHSLYGGFSAELTFPIQDGSPSLEN